MLRRFAGSLGLLGVLLYAALIPGHFVSEATAALIQAELGTPVICHNDAAPAKPAGDTAKHGCPFCHGYAGFQLAALDSGITFFVPPQAAISPAPAEDETGPKRAALAPQSRGPPKLSV